MLSIPTASDKLAPQKSAARNTDIRIGIKYWPQHSAPALLLLVALIGIVTGIAQLLSRDQTVSPRLIPVEYRIDATGLLKVDDLLAEPGAWTKVERVPNFGFSQSTFWFRAGVTNSEQEPVDRLLELAYPILDKVELFVFHDRQLQKHITVGDDLPYAQRPLMHRNFVFPLLLEPGPSTLILRIATSGGVQAPLTLWQPIDFIEYYETQSVIDGSYFGVMVIMVLYNLMLYLGIRERSYLYYVGHVSTTTLFLATMHGLAYMHLWPEAVWWQSRAVPVLVSLSVVFISLFVSSFLGINRDTRWGRIFSFLLAAASISSVFAFFLPYSLALRIAGSLSVIALSCALTVSVWGWLNGNRSARFLVLAWSAFIAGSIALALNKFGLVARTQMTENGMLFGSMLDVVLLSIAMADRVGQERRLREAAQSHAIATEKAARERLEAAVSERTEQLEAAMSELQKANRNLEKLSNLDGLTGAHNRRFFDRYFNAACIDARESGQPVSLVLIDADHFKRINDEFGHLAGDECLKQLADCVSAKAGILEHVMARIGGEEFALVLPGKDLAAAAGIAESIRKAVARLSIMAEGQQIMMSVSLGVASNENGSTATDAIMQLADRALYSAKAAGRNCVRPILDSGST